MTGTALIDRHCQRETGRLDESRAQALLAELHADWSLDTDSAGIRRRFRFDDYYRTMAFVNALAWIVHQQDHHPDLEIGYSRCTVHFSTHSVSGLSENDFICAAKIDALVVNSQ